MCNNNVITKEIKELLGKDIAKPSTLDIEKGMIRKFAWAIGDDNPLWYDEKHAKQTRYKTIIAPPTFLTFTAFWPDKIQYLLANLPSSLKRIMAGKVEYKYFKEVRPGDTVTAYAKIKDAYVKKGKKGKLLFITVEILYKNQYEEIVVQENNTVIRY